MIALTRPVSPAIVRCELVHRPRTPIDAERAAEQHAAYEGALRAAGCRVVRVPGAPDLPDAVFIEDTAVVTDEVAVLARPGAVSRRAEVDAVAPVLAAYRPVRYIEAPGTLDGGDVLHVGDDVYVGLSSRTNREGATQLRDILESLGYAVHTLPVSGCLHLKTAVTAVDANTLLINPEWVDPDRFAPRTVVAVDPSEPFAANVLRVGEHLIRPAGFPATAARQNLADAVVLEVDVSELAKAEGGVTCCCILLRGDTTGV